MMTWRLTILGKPRTKKNSRVAGRDGRVIFASRAWSRWLAGSVISWYEGARAPITVPVNCRARFYRDANRGDAVGFYQGLADLLEKNGVVTNDRLIVSWDGSRLLKDAARPRVEVELTEWPVLIP